MQDFTQVGEMSSLGEISQERTKAPFVPPINTCVYLDIHNNTEDLLVSEKSLDDPCSQWVYCQLRNQHQILTTNIISQCVCVCACISSMTVYATARIILSNLQELQTAFMSSYRVLT